MGDIRSMAGQGSNDIASPMDGYIGAVRGERKIATRAGTNRRNAMGNGAPNIHESESVTLLAEIPIRSTRTETSHRSNRHCRHGRTCRAQPSRNAPCRVSSHGTAQTRTPARLPGKGSAAWNLGWTSAASTRLPQVRGGVRHGIRAESHQNIVWSTAEIASGCRAGASAV